MSGRRCRQATDGALPAADAAALAGGAWLGIDIGSTTTKFALVDAEGRMLAKRYVPTRGRPIEVARDLVAGLCADLGGGVRLLGLATTGSGRQVVGDFLAADLVIDEITAHARGAIAADPEVDTIFEIGGQDAKYIRLEERHAVDFDMNKVCAAGTGSFLHELAAKLGVDIAGEFEAVALASPAPVQLAERCTVFMESDLVSALQRGAPRDDLIAGLAHAVVRNYLNRVVGRRAIGRRVMFLGGPSLNRAVVAAFEQVLGRPVAVPPHREVMGAFGAALAARDAAARGEIAPAERRLDALGAAATSFTERVCRADAACRNECKLRVYDFGGRSSVWGGECGRYEVGRRGVARRPDLFAERAQRFVEALEGRAEVADPRAPAPARVPAGTIGVPLALHGVGWGVFWAHLLAGLGWRVVLSPPTDERIARAGHRLDVAPRPASRSRSSTGTCTGCSSAPRRSSSRTSSRCRPRRASAGCSAPTSRARSSWSRRRSASRRRASCGRRCFLAEGPAEAARDLRRDSAALAPPVEGPDGGARARGLGEAGGVRALAGAAGRGASGGDPGRRAGLAGERPAVQPLRRALQSQDRPPPRRARRDGAAAGFSRARRRGSHGLPRHVLGSRGARPAGGAARGADPESLRRAPDQLRLRRRLLHRALLPARDGGEADARCSNSTSTARSPAC